MDKMLFLAIELVIVVMLVVGIRAMLLLATGCPRKRGVYALGFGSTLVEGGEACRISVRAAVRFTPERLLVSYRSHDFLVDEVLVGDVPVFRPVGLAPVSVLAPGDAFPLGGKVARPGDSVTIIVRNTASAPREFQAVVAGSCRRS